MPHAVYHQLVKRIPEATRLAHNLELERSVDDVEPGRFLTETDFEDEVVVPLLQRWRLEYRRQHPSRFQFGSQDHHCRVDFSAGDERGPLTLFEDTLLICSEEDLAAAAHEVRSFALMLGLGSFVVASPEGLWLYRLDRNRESVAMHVSGSELASGNEALCGRLAALRPDRGRPSVSAWRRSLDTETERPVLAGGASAG